MTANTIAYLSLKETEKSHRNTERENERSNRAREMENTRSNIARENESIRSNMANEDIKRRTNAINDAHFQRQDAETIRSNLAREIENNRHNIATEYTANYNALNSAIDVLNRGVSNIISIGNLRNEQRRTDIQAMNAETTRFSAENKAAVDWENVLIGQGNLDIAQSNLDMLREVNLRKLDLQERDTRSNELLRNASASELLARKAKEEKETEWYSINSIWGNINSSVNSLGGLLRGAGSIIRMSPLGGGS